ncbi:MAG: hypothetical protein ACD_79C00938G0002 [uncultured bacterium]|nr:MAG: hypothetical protein ACD_79C00938G0002 [uncultured bacterium]
MAEKKPQNFENISEIIQRIIPSLTKNELGKTHLSGEIIDEWNNIIGDPFCKHTKPEKIYKGVLTIKVDSSVILHELNVCCKYTLLKTIQEKWPWITGLNFQYGSINKKLINR